MATLTSRAEELGTIQTNISGLALAGAGQIDRLERLARDVIPALRDPR
jgi:hypothetical protein